MKKRILIEIGLILLAAIVTSRAATVEINLRDFGLQSLNQPVTITNRTAPTFAGTNVIAQPAKTYTPTNGQVRASLVAGSYYAIIGPYKIAFSVPNDTNTYQLSAVATNGTTVENVNGAWASTNYVVTATNILWQSTTNYVTTATNGLASTNYVVSATNTLAGALTTNWTYQQPVIYGAEIRTNLWMKMDGPSGAIVSWTNYGQGLQAIQLKMSDSIFAAIGFSYDDSINQGILYLLGDKINLSYFVAGWLGTDEDGNLINRGWPTNFPSGQQITNSQLYSSVRYQLTQHQPDSNGTNYVLDLSGPSSRYIVCTNNVNFSAATNLTTGFEIGVTYTIFPNGANRTISWPTNWQTLSSNAFNSPVTLTNGRVARIAFSFVGISSSATNILVGGVQQ